MRKQKTFMAKKTEKANWLLIDAKGKTLGRLASEIAKVLRGKHKPTYTPHVDCGDGVIVINAKAIHTTGNKATQKEYFHYTGFMSGLRRLPFEFVMNRHPDRILRTAVTKMMPRTKQARAQLKKLRIFAEGEHTLDAQKPLKVEC